MPLPLLALLSMLASQPPPAAAETPQDKESRERLVREQIQRNMGVLKNPDPRPALGLPATQDPSCAKDAVDPVKPKPAPPPAMPATPPGASAGSSCKNPHGARATQ